MVKIFEKFCHPKIHPNRLLQMETIIKPIYIITSLLGLFPYSIKFQNSEKIFATVKKSVYLNSLCGISVILTIFIFTALHIENVLQSTENVSMIEAIMTRMNYVLELVALLSFCTVAYVCAFLNRDKYVKVLNMVISTWSDISNDIDSQNILSVLQIHVKILAIGSILLVLIVQCGVNFTRHNTIWKMILVALSFNLPQTIQFTVHAFYYSLVMMLVAILDCINEHCLLLTKNNKDALNEFVQVKSKSSVTLRHMESAYVKAFEIKNYINTAFQGPILASALQCFHCIVSEAHIIYHGLMVEKNLSTHDALNCSSWIAYQILKIYSLSYAGNLLKMKALNIAQSLHNIPTEKHDLRWLMEIQHFSSLLSYQTIEMTVYQYFPLDATLMYNMLASAMMYLIILVQFDKAVK